MRRGVNGWTCHHRNMQPTRRWRRQPIVTGIAFGAAVAGFVTACSSGPTTHDAQWTLVRASPSASQVLVTWLHGTCDTLVDGSADVSGHAVRITLREKTASGTCDTKGIGQLVWVRLGTRLGHRTIEGCGPHDTCRPAEQAVPRNLSRYHLKVVGP